MQAVDISAEIQALLDTAAEAWKKEVSAATKKQFSVSVIHLTVTLRNIRSEARNRVSPVLLDFLLRTIPCALHVFNSTLATYHVNKELCRQTTVFLGSLFGVPRPAGLSRNVASALKNILDAIPPCFFALASAGRRDDVRSLLNAVVLVAGSFAEWKMTNSWPCLLVSSRIRGSTQIEDPVITAFRTILAGWIAAGSVLNQWSTVDYVDIAEGISVALTMRLENGQEAAKQRLASGMRATVQSLLCSSKEVQGSLIHSAFASGVLRAVEDNPLKDDYQFKEELSRSIKKNTEYKMGSLQSLADHDSITSFKDADRETISMVFLVLRVARTLKHALTTEEMHTFCLTIEALMKSAVAVDKKTERHFDLLHRQLFWCVNSYSVMLGYAYAAFSDQSSTLFLRELMATQPSNAAVNRFCAASVLRWNCSATIAADLTDILSFTTETLSALFKLCIPRLVPVISQDLRAISYLAGLVIALLQEFNVAEPRARIFFLLDTICLCLSHRHKTLERAASEPVSNTFQQNSRPELWDKFATILQHTLTVHAHDDAFCSRITECLCQMLRNEEQDCKSAQTQLTILFPSLLVQNYVFEGPPGSEKRRLLHAASVFDILAERSMSDTIAKEFIDNVLESSNHVNDRRNRLIGVLLLRFLGRCNVDLFNIVSDGVSRFIGVDQQRKLQFLPLARLSVLGMDMLRKDKSIEWLLAFFRDVSGTEKVDGSISSRALARL